MFDTMTMTKVMGGLCGTFLVFLLGAWLAEEIYHSGGHGDYHDMAYVVEPVVDEGGEEAVEEEVDFATVFAAASAEDGEGLWRNCRSCHALEAGVHGVGPALHGVVDRQVAFYDDFNYSGSLVAVAEKWSPENLNAFLENPGAYAPGTAMGYNGMRDIEDRANLIAYLQSVAN